MVNRYFIFDITVILLFIIFITIKVLIKMSKLKVIEGSNDLRNKQDNLIKFEVPNYINKLEYEFDMVNLHLKEIELKLNQLDEKLDKLL
jgi:predicted nuclease with TOPRIM domain